MELQPAGMDGKFYCFMAERRRENDNHRQREMYRMRAVRERLSRREDQSRRGKSGLETRLYPVRTLRAAMSVPGKADAENADDPGKHSAPNRKRKNAEKGAER